MFLYGLAFCVILCNLVHESLQAFWSGGSCQVAVVTWCLRTYIGLRPYMVKVDIKERINDQITICAGGVTGNTTYLGE